MALEPIAPDVWVASMDHRFMGLHLGTRMTVVRLSDGSLFVYSPIRLDYGLKDEIDALGPVGHIVAPSLFHHLFVGDFAMAYPEAKTYGAPGLQKKRQDLHFDAVLGAEPDPAWGDSLRSQRVEGCALGEVVFFHEPTRTLISTDLIENFETSEHWPTRAYLKVAGIYGKSGLSRLLRPMFRDKAAARGAIDQLIDWNPKRITLAHGEPIVENGREALRQAYEWLKA